MCCRSNTPQPLETTALCLSMLLRLHFSSSLGNINGECCIGMYKKDVYLSMKKRGSVIFIPSSFVLFMVGLSPLLE